MNKRSRFKPANAIYDRYGIRYDEECDNLLDAIHFLDYQSDDGELVKVAVVWNKLYIGEYEPITPHKRKKWIKLKYSICEEDVEEYAYDEFKQVAEDLIEELDALPPDSLLENYLEVMTPYQYREMIVRFLKERK